MAPFVTTVAALFGAGATSAAIGVTAWRARRPTPDRRGWVMLCAGITTGLVGYGSSHAGGVPALAWVALYLQSAAFYAAFLLFARSSVRNLPVSMWVDGPFAVLSLTAVTSAFVVPHLAETLDRPWTSVALHVVRPLTDLVLLAIAGGVRAVVGSLDPRWRALTLAAIAFVASSALAVAVDLRPGDLAAAPVIACGGLAGVGWIIAARRPFAPPLTDERQRTIAQGPLLFAGLALVVVVHHALFGGSTRIQHVALVQASAALALAGVRLAVTLREIRLLAESRVEARTDALTGLGNRRRLEEEVGQLLDEHREVALVVLDLDRFKEVNDSLGHHVGDELLRVVGSQIASVVPEVDDRVYRLGGDEFAVVIADAARAEGVARAIETSLTQPMTLSGRVVVVDASLGVARFPDHGHDTGTLLRAADVAMYDAKRTRAGIVEYDPERDPHSVARFDLVTEFRAADLGAEIEVHYQPLVDVASGHVAAVEALVRWQHPSRGLLGPGDFLEIAEQTGRMAEITEVVLDHALGRCAAWRRLVPELCVSVNLSGEDLSDPELTERVTAALDRHQLPASALELEVTETSLMERPDCTRTVLGRLRSMGIELAIDDYGTGYSSLAYLRDLPVTKLKIDRSFGQSIAGDAVTAAIVASTIELGHALGLGVVIEGVEDEATLERLRALGADRAQGWHLGRPQAAREVPAVLAGRYAQVERVGPVTEAVTTGPEGAAIASAM